MNPFNPFSPFQQFGSENPQNSSAITGDPSTLYLSLNLIDTLSNNDIVSLSLATLYLCNSLSISKFDMQYTRATNNAVLLFQPLSISILLSLSLIHTLPTNNICTCYLSGLFIYTVNSIFICTPLTPYLNLRQPINCSACISVV